MMLFALSMAPQQGDQRRRVSERFVGPPSFCVSLWPALVSIVETVALGC